MTLTPAPSPEITSGIPAYKARHRKDGFSVAIRFELSADDLAAVLYAHCLDEDPLSLSDQEIHELAVMALAGPAHAMVAEAREQVARDRETPSGIPGFSEAECIVAVAYLGYCEQRAAGITQAPAGA